MGGTGLKSRMDERGNIYLYFGNDLTMYVEERSIVKAGKGFCVKFGSIE